MEEQIQNQIKIFKRVYEAVVKEAKTPFPVPYVNIETVRHIYHEVNKDIRLVQPSPKQIEYAKDLGIENPEQFTKSELAHKIEEKVGR